MRAPARVGGQALGNGVMLRAGSTVAVATRRPDGTIQARSWSQHRRTTRFDSVPVLRIITNLGAAMAGSARALTVARRTRRGGFNRLARLAAFAAFFVLVEVFATFLWDRLQPTASYGGALRSAAVQVLALVGALFVARVSPYGKRLFTYHGAEHQTVMAFELGLDASTHPEVVARLPRVHPRCGTHLVLWLCLVAGALQVVQHGPLADTGVQLAVLLMSVGVVAEALRQAGNRQSWWARALRAPGSALQHLTTRQAGPAECEVALAALRELFPIPTFLASLPRDAGIAAACTSASAPSSSS